MELILFFIFILGFVSYSISKLSKLINGQIVGDNDSVVKGVCSIKSGKEEHLTYLKNNSYKKYIKDSKASVFIVNNDYNQFFKLI
mgnify:CR=1 FL=1